MIDTHILYTIFSKYKMNTELRSGWSTIVNYSRIAFVVQNFRHSIQFKQTQSLQQYLVTLDSDWIWITIYSFKIKL